MARFIRKGHLDGQTQFYCKILVRHLSEKSDISLKVRFFATLNGYSGLKMHGDKTTESTTILQLRGNIECSNSSTGR